MPRYKVTYVFERHVNADNEDEAADKAMNSLDGYDFSDWNEYTVENLDEN